MHMLWAAIKKGALQLQFELHGAPNHWQDLQVGQVHEWYASAIACEQEATKHATQCREKVWNQRLAQNCLTANHVR